MTTSFNRKSFFSEEFDKAHEIVSHKSWANMILFPYVLCKRIQQLRISQPQDRDR